MYYDQDKKNLTTILKKKAYEEISSIIPIFGKNVLNRSQMMGEGLSTMNGKDLKNLETKLEKGISRIRSKKVFLVTRSFFLWFWKNKVRRFTMLI